MADQSLRVLAPIERVELFEDRASVSRRIDLPSTPGRHQLEIGPLTPLVRERGLSFLPSAEVVVEEAHVRRSVLTREEADPQRVHELRQRVEEQERVVGQAERAAQRTADAARRAEASVESAREWLPRALVTSDDPAGWVGALRRLFDARTAARLAAVVAARELEPLRADLALLRSSLDAARLGSSATHCTVFLTVLVREPGQLVMRTTIPCAVWRPVHRATLSGQRVSWEVGAMCWNATGEDWEDVELVCSTARPGGLAEPPVLRDDLLYTRRRDKDVVVEAREEDIHVAREEARRVSEQVPGVDDGGETRNYTAPHRVSLPSDGRPVQISLEAWESEAALTWVAHPERSSQVVLRSRQANAGSRPLLAGPVDLFRDSGAVGRGFVGLVGPGEPFSVGWGSHDGLRLTRRRDHEIDRARITGRKTHQFEVALRLVHLGDEPVQVEVSERVPVSELKDVRVTDPRAEPPLSTGPDGDGFCTWRLALEPGDSRQLSLAYEVEAAANVHLPW